MISNELSEDADLAFALYLQELDGDEDHCEVISEAQVEDVDSVATINGVEYVVPYECVTCAEGPTFDTKDKLEAHFKLKAHAMAARAFTRGDLALSEGEVNAIQNTVLYNKPLPPLDPLSRIRKRAADFAAATPPGPKIPKSDPLTHRTGPRSQGAKASTPETKVRFEGDRGADPQGRIAILRAIASDQSLTHSERNSEDRVLLLDVDAIIRYYGKMDEIPIGRGDTVVCMVCSPRAELRCRETLLAHCGSSKHKAAADAAANAEERRLSSSSSFSSAGPVRRDAHRSFPTMGHGAKPFSCSNFKCKNRFTPSPRDFISSNVIQCPSCKLQQELRL